MMAGGRTIGGDGRSRKPEAEVPGPRLVQVVNRIRSTVTGQVTTIAGSVIDSITNLVGVVNKTSGGVETFVVANPGVVNVPGVATATAQTDGTQKARILDENGVAFSASNPLPTEANATVDAGNTSILNLGIGATFTGVWHSSLGCGVVQVNVISDQASATNGLVIEYGSDGVSAVQNDVFSILANVGKTFTFTPPGAYYRVKYTNGAVAQTSFNLETICRPGFKPSSHRIQDSIVGEDDAELMKAVLTAQKPDGTFTNIQCTSDGNLRTSLNVSVPSELKFGRQDAIGKLAVWTIWDVASAYPAWPGNGTLAVVAEKAADVSIGITVIGLDATGAEVSDTITTNAADGTVSSTTGADVVFADTYRARVSAGAEPTGYIDVTRAGTVVQRIVVGFNQTENTRWVVPTIINGVTYAGAWLKQITFNVGATDKCNVRLVIKEPTDVVYRTRRYYGNVQGPIGEEFTNGGTIAGLWLPAGSIIAMQGQALNTTAEVSASYLAGMALVAP